MEKSMSFESSGVKPRLIIHGGAGNIHPANLSPEAWAKYRESLVRIYRSADKLLQSGGSALDAATHAVASFEDDELFNCGKGAVFTRDGTNELEASIMTTKGHDKRACAAVMLKHVRNPIKLAREMLLRGDQSNIKEKSLSLTENESVGAQGHLCLGGKTAEKLAKEWGLELVGKHYFWTKKRWQQHRRGLGKKTNGAEASEQQEYFESIGDSGDWDGVEYLPQGTTGCVALDSTGTIAVATSTGGLTNKLPFRIGDTPTIGAGFWAEQWDEAPLDDDPPLLSKSSFIESAQALFGDCLPHLGTYESLQENINRSSKERIRSSRPHAIAVSGTGNGDSFLKLAASRTVGAIVRFSYPSIPARTLASAFNQIVGPGGEMQRSAGSRWGQTGEGEGGMIGIELKEGRGIVCWDFNCGGMFRCWTDPSGTLKVGVFRKEESVNE